jgi:hypothetical protein
MERRLNGAEHYSRAIKPLSQRYVQPWQRLFSPCFKFCTEYKRAVGYFSSKALLMWLEALPRFETNAVKIYLLISPELSAEDRAALEKAMDEGERQRLRQVTADSLIQELLEDPNKAEPNRVKLFAWMLVGDHFVLRFAFPEHVERPGIFHEKIGVFQVYIYNWMTSFLVFSATILIGELALGMNRDRWKLI